MTAPCHFRAFVAVVLHFLQLSCATQWPFVQQSVQEALPNIEISLAPPLHPWPQVAAELGNLEESREKMENANMARLQTEFNKATLDARRRVGDIIGRMLHVFDDPKLTNTMLARRRVAKSAAMLHQLPPEILGSSMLSVKVNALPPNPPDPLLRADIDDIESLRSNKESDMFESAIDNLKTLSSFVLKELEVQLSENIDHITESTARTGMAHAPLFLEERTKQLPAQPNIRAVPADTNYPTVASMVQDMETRRDISENLERKQTLEKELDFILACNDAMEEGLKAAVSRIMARHSSLTKSLQSGM